MPPRALIRDPLVAVAALAALFSGPGVDAERGRDATSLLGFVAPAGCVTIPVGLLKIAPARRAQASIAPAAADALPS